MQTGDVVADRFEVEELAGSGGMGTVYRARDRLNGERVALKLLQSPGETGTARFAREARTLAELSHPCIVRYVAHGTTAAGEPYLAMEWLEGEDLSDRVARTPLTIEEAVSLGARVADALGVAHARGLIHRDIKPANLFLVGASLERVKLLDFGLVRTAGFASALTRTGFMVGTPGYMAPEQARNERHVDARADVFALGCVLFKCITGKAPFVGEDLVAVLTKILFEPSPRLRDARPDAPPALDELLGAMLEKDPAKRPADGQAVAERLRALGPITPGARAPMASQVEVLTGGERRLLSMVLVRGAAVEHVLPDHSASRTLEAPGGGSFVAAQEVAARYGGRIERLADGSTVVALSGSGNAGDQAAKAARCALAMRALAPDVPIALATGRADASSDQPLGEVIDRAARLLRAEGLPHPAIAVDEITAGLLDTAFEVDHIEGQRLLRGERGVVEARRTLLGKPTPCVGRVRELGALSALLDECIDEPVARVVLVTASPGVGKSRLRYEFLRKLGERPRPPQVWIARGDPMSVGAPLHMLAQMVRRAAGLLEGEPLELRRQKLTARVARTVGAADQARVSQFLGEIVGVPFEAGASVLLRAARQDAMLLGDQMRRAWEDFVGAECRARPLVIVLEDLHWGDLPTVKFVDAALRVHHDRPLLALAFARPEVTELFPRLWAERAVVPMPLAELTRKASERLVREVLGDRVADEQVARVVDRAAGNAFYLEELIRSVASGQDGSLPETVLAMVEARVQALEPEARRVLRAASVFGQVFWCGGVEALVGGSEMTVSAREWLAELSHREVITARPEARFPGETEYVFRHALVRDAAHGMLTDRDRALGHRLAAEWLEGAGEEEAIVLAEHFERGGDQERAVGWYRKAAGQALAANDFDAVVARAERAIVAGAAGEVRGELRLLQTEAHRWRGDAAAAERSGAEAVALLPRGGSLWCAAVGELGAARFRVGKQDALFALAEEFLGVVRGVFERPQVMTALRLSNLTRFAGGGAVADALLAHAGAATSEGLDRDPLLAARRGQALAAEALIGGDPIGYLRWMASAAESFERAGDVRSACTPRTNVGFANGELGRYPEAERTLRDVMLAADRMGLRDVAGAARHNLGFVLARRGAVEEALRVEAESCAVLAEVGHKRLQAAAHTTMAEIQILAGDLDAAAKEAETALTLSGTLAPARAWALAEIANVHLLRGQKAEALAPAAEAMKLLRDLGGIDQGESLVRLVYARALEASGDAAGGRAAIEEARAAVLARANKMSDPAVRESFLESVRENRDILALAEQWAAATR